MSFFKDLTPDASIAKEKDSVGGGGVLETGLYPATITLAYGTVSAGGARGLVLHAKTSQGREIRQTLWTSSGTAKGGKHYYEKDGEKIFLPGFMAADSLCLLTTGKELFEQDTEVKVVNVWSRDAKAEVPTKVDMLVDMIGKEIIIGLFKQTVDKTAKNAMTGEYEPTGETREENEIDKFFRASDKMTTAEIRAADNEPAFYSIWESKFSGIVRNKTKSAPGTAGAPKGSFSGGAAMKKPANSLFA